MQAQGGGIDESESWARDAPLPACIGHELLDSLSGKLAPSERRHREKGFEQAHRYVDRAARAGGTGPIGKSFPFPPRGDQRRVDVEVQAGLAFVPAPEKEGPGDVQ